MKIQPTSSWAAMVCLSLFVCFHSTSFGQVYPGNTGFESWKEVEQVFLEKLESRSYLYEKKPYGGFFTSNPLPYNLSSQNRSQLAHTGRYSFYLNGGVKYIQPEAGIPPTIDSLVVWVKSKVNNTSRKDFAPLVFCAFGVPDSDGSLNFDDVEVVNFTSLNSEWQRLSIKIPDIIGHLNDTLNWLLGIATDADTFNLQLDSKYYNEIWLDNISMITKESDSIALPWGNFEDWKSTSLNLPVGWTKQDIHLDSSLITSSTNSAGGNFSIKLKTVVNNGVTERPALSSALIPIKVMPEFFAISARVEGSLDVSDFATIYVSFYNKDTVPIGALDLYEYQDEGNSWNSYKFDPKPYYMPDTLSYFKISLIGGITNNPSNSFAYFIDDMHFDAYVSTENLTNSNLIYQVYPNPANEVLNVVQGEFKNCLIQLVDLHGKIVYSIRSTEEMFNQVAEIPISNVPSGSYYVQLVDQFITYNKAVTIIH